jgi:glycosyltransferase involved in cell wall biosynthesis
MDVGLISIIIRVRNIKRHFLYESLSSALSQTYKNIEVVVVFDKGNP